MINRHLLSILAIAMAFGGTVMPRTTAYAADVLTVGSKAPVLDVEHWVQDGKGKFKPVKEFAPGKVYVVEFWATWCGPCIMSMPHLAELQTSMADKGVQIISISDEDLETVEKFLEREVRQAPKPADDTEEKADEDAKKQTYRDLTSAYCLTTDPDQSTYEDYMQAAAQNGIPTAFIVGKDASIEWIGHPMEMDGPLNAIVEDKWDREVFAVEFKASQAAELERQKTAREMRPIITQLQEGNFDEAIKMIDEVMVKKPKDLQLNMLKLQALLVAEKFDDAVPHLSKVYETFADTPETVNMVSWNIYEMAAQAKEAKEEFSPALITSSLTAAKAAAEKAETAEKASILDTIAHLAFLTGDIDQAIAAETEALKLAPPEQREFMQQFLDELNAAKKQ